MAPEIIDLTVDTPPSSPNHPHRSILSSSTAASSSSAMPIDHHRHPPISRFDYKMFVRTGQQRLAEPIPTTAGLSRFAYGGVSPSRVFCRWVSDLWISCPCDQEVHDQPFSLQVAIRTLLMTEERQKAIWAIYIWCRRTDELVDGPNSRHMNSEVLERWEERLEDIFEGRPYDMLDAALTHTVLNIPVRYQAF